MDRRRKVTHRGEITLGENALQCYVLEDGTRILSGRGMQETLMMVDTADGKQTAGTRLGRYLNQKSLETFIYQGKDADHYEPLECYDGNTKINGYEANILVDICEAFLKARKSIKLSPRQQIIADQCEILVRGFARIGLVALIDEATGYQYERERFELQKVLTAYVSEEVLKWQLTFTDEFYKEIFRLWKQPFTPSNIRKRPPFIANITIKYVYEQLPDGVLEKIKELTPRTERGYRYRLHQSLTEEVGREHLKKQIHEVTALMSVADDKTEFIGLFEKKYGVKGEIKKATSKAEVISHEQLDLDFFFGQEDQLSVFDQGLKKALDYGDLQAR